MIAEGTELWKAEHRQLEPADYDGGPFKLPLRHLSMLGRGWVGPCEPASGPAL